LTERDRQFADAARVIDESVVTRLVSASVAAIEAAAADSKITATLKRFRMSQVGVAVAIGGITHALLLQLMPTRLAPARPLAYWMVVAFAGLVAVAGLITMRKAATATADRRAGTANTRKSSCVE
jgi:hypothetical protein